MRAILFLVVLVWSLSVWAGHSSNGGAPSVDNENVWFLGDETVEYCIVIDKSFPFTYGAVQKMVASSIADWIDFFDEQDLNDANFPGTVKGRSLKLALNFKQVSECHKPKEQIVFMFGGMADSIKDALKYDEGALGLSVRGEYNHKTFRNGGIVWIKNWPYEAAELKHIVLHEVGHVFGMQHDSVHVMDGKIADHLIKKQIPENLLGQIESSLWPYRFSTDKVIDFAETGRNEIDGMLAEPNLLLNYLWEIFGLQKNGYHLAAITSTTSETPGNLKLRFEIYEFETLEHIIFDGTFHIGKLVNNQRDGERGPVLYTDWDCEQCGRKAERCVHYLDVRSANMTANGSFSRGGVVYPAVLEQKKGLVLKIFIPQKNAWWTSENYQAAYFLRD